MSSCPSSPSTIDGDRVTTPRFDFSVQPAAEAVDPCAFCDMMGITGDGTKSAVWGKQVTSLDPASDVTTERSFCPFHHQVMRDGHSPLSCSDLLSSPLIRRLHSEVSADLMLGVPYTAIRERLSAKYYGEAVQESHITTRQQHDKV